MTGRISSRFLVQALIRRVEVEGGFAAILHVGDPDSGSIMVQLIDRRAPQIQLLERIPDFSGGYRLEPVAPQYSDDPMEMAQYVDRRIKADRDMWLVELDVANAQQLADEILIIG
ncbi:MAG: DUF1491 family protein [Sphingobium sp.]